MLYIYPTNAHATLLEPTARGGLLQAMLPPHRARSVNSRLLWVNRHPPAPIRHCGNN